MADFGISDFFASRHDQRRGPRPADRLDDELLDQFNRRQAASLERINGPALAVAGRA